MNSCRVVRSQAKEMCFQARQGYFELLESGHFAKAWGGEPAFSHGRKKCCSISQLASYHQKHEDRCSFLYLLCTNIPIRLTIQRRQGLLPSHLQPSFPSTLGEVLLPHVGTLLLQRYLCIELISLFCQFIQWSSFEGYLLKFWPEMQKWQIQQGNNMFVAQK